ncbi:MAG: VanW family protein [Solirubrobacteraceae bacterium]|nr:VanW family protein [Solirubrobacteraceae bacterium]
MGAGALLLLLLVAGLVVRASNDGKILPGTRVADVGVGGLTPERARERLRPALGDEGSVRLRTEGRTVDVARSDAGYSVDMQATIDAAERSGREGVLGGLPATLRGLLISRNVDARVRVDDEKLEAAVTQVAEKIDGDPFPGGLQIDINTREVTIKRPRAGRMVNRDELTKRLRRELTRGGRGPIDVPVRTVEPVSDDRLAEIADEAREYLRQDLVLTGAGEPLTLGKGKIARLLAVESNDSGRTAFLGVDRERLSQLVAQLTKRGAVAARNARISAPAVGGVLTGKDEVTWKARSAKTTVTPARQGRAVKREEVGTALRKGIAAGRHRIAVPMKTTDPEISTAEARKVDQLLGTFTTPYVAGQPRVTNIQQMARTVDMTLIPDGGQFSLNGITGERTKAKGYVEAPFIANNRIEPSVGGGVSQFSTTMYNAAYFAGLPLDAYRPHSLYIDRYPPGRESTLNFPDIDMKWTNDTGAPILVRTSYDAAGVSVALYGHNGGRRVTASPGARQPVEGGDFSITVTRRIRYGDGRTVEQPITTRYETESKAQPPAEGDAAPSGE